MDSVDEKEFAAKVISSELDKAFRSRQEFICPDLKKVLEEYKHVRGSKNNRQYEMCGSWCKEYNDFYEKQGFIVDRWNERYGDDKGARTLLFSVGEKNFLEFRKAIDSGEFYKTIMEFSAKIHLPKGVRDKLDKVLEERGLKK